MPVVMISVRGCELLSRTASLLNFGWPLPVILPLAQGEP